MARKRNTIDAALSQQRPLLFATEGAMTRSGASRFIKDVCKVGRYRHPVQGWELDVTPERLEKWVANFGAMKAAGIDVEITVDHQHTADAVRGYVSDMWTDGERLWAVHDFTHPDGATLARSVRNVSLEIDPAFVDGEKRVYGECVTHSSLCQKPVVSGQGEFRALSLLPTPDPQDSTGDTDMEFQKQLLELLQSELKLTPKPEAEGAELTPADVVRAISDASSATAEATATAAAAHKAELAKIQAELSAATKAAADAAAKAAPPPEANPEVTEVLAEANSERLQGLIAAGCITPTVGIALSALLIGPADARNVLCLSRAPGQDKALARAVIDALKENRPVDLTQRTGAQLLSLQDPNKAGNDGLTDGAKLARQEMLERIQPVASR